MSTARRRLKSPQSPYSTCTTHRSQSWSWKIDSHSFRSSQSKKTKTKNKKNNNFDLETTRSKPWVWSQRARPYSQPIIKLTCFLFISHQSDKNSWDTAILIFIVMGEVRGQGHIVHPVSSQCTSLLFHINRTNHSWDISNRVFDLEWHIRNFEKKKVWQARVSNKIHPKSNRVMTTTRVI